MPILDEIAVFARVNRMVDSVGGAASAGRKLNVSRQHVSAMLNDRRPMSPALLALAGVRQVYELIEPDAQPAPDWNAMKRAVGR